MTKTIEFKMPEALEIPDGISNGETFESMATFQVKKGGRLCLVAIGEHKMPGYSQHEQPRQPDPGKEAARKYHAALGDQ